jgi:hypothetical protein
MENKDQEIKEVEKVEDGQFVEKQAEEVSQDATTQASPAYDNEKAKAIKEKVLECKGKVCDFARKNKKGVIAVVLVLVILGLGFWGFKSYRKMDVGPVAAKAGYEKFIKDNLIQPGTDFSIKDIVRENGLYKMTLVIGKQELVTYGTLDGKKLFQPNSVIDLEKKPETQDDSAAKATPAKTEAENKTDVPEVDLFVMSYCPYGLQMERGILPAVKTLGNKIKFNLKFVGYTLHGQKEVDENVRQYCIEKTQPTKLASYLGCFWKKSAGTSDACMRAVGVDAAQVVSCTEEAGKQFTLTEKDFSINKEDNTKFGVQGSPTLVVNGTTVSSGRDSASVLKAICSGFSNQPKECQAKLSATSPAAGFDDQAQAKGATAAGAAGAACGQ